MKTSLFLAVALASVPSLSWSQAAMACKEMVTGAQNDPGGERKDFAALARCRVITRAIVPDEKEAVVIKQTVADFCVGRYSDAKTGKGVSMIWGSTKSDLGGGFDWKEDFKLIVPDGSRTKRTSYGSTVTETGADTPQAIVVRRIEDSPAGPNPNKDGSDEEDTFTFSKNDLTLRLYRRARGNWPLQGWWKKRSEYLFSCVKE